MSAPVPIPELVRGLRAPVMAAVVMALAESPRARDDLAWIVHRGRGPVNPVRSIQEALRRHRRALAGHGYRIEGSARAGGVLRLVAEGGRAPAPGCAVEVLVARVAAVTGVSAGRLLRGSRVLEEARARWFLCRCLRDRGLSLPAIGRIVGRDHTTVLYGLRRWDDVAGSAPCSGWARALDALEAGAACGLDGLS